MIMTAFWVDIFVLTPYRFSYTQYLYDTRRLSLACSLL